MFSRIDDKENPAYPGLALALAAGRRPVVVRRTNYHTDSAFEGKYDPHPDHTAPETLSERTARFQRLEAEQRRMDAQAKIERAEADRKRQERAEAERERQETINKIARDIEVENQKIREKEKADRDFEERFKFSLRKYGRESVEAAINFRLQLLKDDKGSKRYAHMKDNVLVRQILDSANNACYWYEKVYGRKKSIVDAIKSLDPKAKFIAEHSGDSFPDFFYDLKERHSFNLRNLGFREPISTWVMDISLTIALVSLMFLLSNYLIGIGIDSQIYGYHWINFVSMSFALITIIIYAFFSRPHVSKWGTTLILIGSIILSL